MLFRSGRTHRPGQSADEVDVTVYGHTFTLRDSMRNACRDAGVLERILRTPAKLEMATFDLHFDRHAPLEHKEMFDGVDDDEEKADDT